MAIRKLGYILFFSNVTHTNGQTLIIIFEKKSKTFDKYLPFDKVKVMMTKISKNKWKNFKKT